MVAPNGNERRREPRANLPGPCPCFFHVSGKRYPAFLVDLSSTGAGFRNFEMARALDLDSGDSTRFDVITPYGRGSYTGRVAWARSLDGGHAWGLQLSAPVRESEGPLETLLVAAFPPQNA